MHLWLSRDHAQTIADHALAEKPREACGVVFGSNDRASQVIPLTNIAADPNHNYRIDDQALAEAFFRAQREGQSIVAFYHSHPVGDPIPSPVDVQQANYPTTPYLIVGLRNEPRFAAWLIQSHQVTPVDLYIGTEPPPNSPSLSQAQKTAIIVAAVIAFAFMIILSLSLLPPAPVIVTPIP